MWIASILPSDYKSAIVQQALELISKRVVDRLNQSDATVIDKTTIDIITGSIEFRFYNVLYYKIIEIQVGVGVILQLTFTGVYPPKRSIVFEYVHQLTDVLTLDQVKF